MVPFFLQFWEGTLKSIGTSNMKIIALRSAMWFKSWKEHARTHARTHERARTHATLWFHVHAVCVFKKIEDFLQFCIIEKHPMFRLPEQPVCRNVLLVVHSLLIRSLCAILGRLARTAWDGGRSFLRLFLSSIFLLVFSLFLFKLIRLHNVFFSTFLLFRHSLLVVNLYCNFLQTFYCKYAEHVYWYGGRCKIHVAQSYRCGQTKINFIMYYISYLNKITCDFENGSLCNFRVMLYVIDTSVALVKQTGIILWEEE